MSHSRSFYVTTPIYYVNDSPHIGHAYTTTLADVLNRYHQLLGKETFFLTGTDEHGQKVQQAAAKRGVSPQEHVDIYNVRFKDLWKRLGISYDYFIRTTDQDHKSFVRECLQTLWDRGEIYVKEYEGWYSVSEERFFAEDELIDGKDPIGGKPVEWIQEKNYFFRMSRYQQDLIRHIKQNPDWILPDFRRNEVLGFLRQPLNDLCISRPKSRLSWGIPLPFDEDFVTYVWFDALINYVSAVRDRRYPSGSPIWPATLHLIGKDILTTHCVYWPTMLMALGIELPRHILAHGWWLNGGAKMSKSSGNVVNPEPYMERFGADVFRYFLIRDMVVGQDATFSDEAFIRRINTDLANDLGNGINRIHKLTESCFGGELPQCLTWGEAEETLRQQCARVLESLGAWLDQIKLSQIVEEALNIAKSVNRYLEIKAPWKLAKDPDRRQELSTVLWTGAESLRVALVLLSPVMPQKALQGLALLGAKSVSPQALRWGFLQGGERLDPAPQGGLFPRIEAEIATEDQSVLPDLRVARIIQVEHHPNADSLYKLTLDIGAGPGELRTVCAGIKKSYAPEALINRLVIWFANLKATQIRGVESQGMLLAADDSQGKARLLTPPTDAQVGDAVRFAGTAEQPRNQTAKIKDWERLKVIARSGHVYDMRDRRLEVNGKPVCVEAPDGFPVR